MGDTWIDATQSYENETNTASTIITNIDNNDLLTPPETSDANYLIKLVNNASTNTNNLYILQANTNGEIRFLTKEAYLNNDVSANDGNQYYNVKIGADGKLYCYYTYDLINNPIKISGWYDVMNDLAGQGFQLSLLEAGFAGFELQLITAQNNITTLFANIGVLNTEIVQINAEIGALATQADIFQGLFGEIQRTFYAARSKVLVGRFTRTNWKEAVATLRRRFDLRQTAGRLGNVMSPARTLTAPQLSAYQMVSSQAGLAINKAVNDVGLTLGIVAGGAVLAGIYRYYMNAEEDTKRDLISDLIETKEDMLLQQANTPNAYYTTANRIAEVGLSVNAGTQGNYTGAVGFYEVSLATSPNSSTGGYIVIEIYLVSTVKTARISKVLDSGTRAWAVGNTISIDKQTDLGGWDNAGTRYLLLNVNTVYSPLQAIDLIINSVLAEQPIDDRRNRRRAGVIGVGEYDTATFTTASATETNTDTNEIITYSTLKSRINLLPTGASDVDVYTSTGKIGIGTTPETILHTYHASDNILRLGTGTTGKSQIQFKRGTDIDTFTDFRLITDAGVFKLQYEDNTVAYGGNGGDMIWSSKTQTTIFKDAELQGRVGVGGSIPTLSRLKIYGVSAETLLAEFINSTGTQGININTTSITATGTDANIPISLVAKGTSALTLNTNGASRLSISSSGAVSIGSSLSADSATITNSISATTFTSGSATSQLLHNNNSIIAQGSDLNIPISMRTKGTGSFTILTGSTPTVRLNISDTGVIDLGTGNLSTGAITATGTIVAGTIASSLTLTSGTLSATGTIAVQSLSIASQSVGNITLSTNGTTRQTISGATGLATFANDLTVSGRVGVGKAASATYYLDVNGDVNIPTGSVYRINGTPISSGVSFWVSGAVSTNIYYNGGNVGIGATTTSDVQGNTAFAIPTAVLYVKGGASVGGTCNVFIRGGVEGQNGGKAKLWLASDASHSSYIQSEHTGSGNTQLTFGTANGNALPDEKMRIGNNGNVSIGTTDTATYKLNVNGNSFFNGVLNHNTRYRPDDNFACNKINLWGTGGNYGFGIDGGTLDYFTGSTHRWWSGSGGTNFGTQRMNLTDASLTVYGSATINGDLFVSSSRSVIYGSAPTLYLRDTDNRSSMLHCNGDQMYFLSANGTNSETWAQQANGAWPLQLNLNNNTAYFGGEIYAYFAAVSMTNTDYLCVQYNYPYIGFYTPNWIRVAYGSFTAFHRCYTDDVLYNNTTDEDINLFKDKYKGRVVIATGKIKTDFSRTVENDEEPKLDPLSGNPLPDNKGEEWYSGIDKDGISIEDAVPVIAFSRKKKDKRVFGVLGAPSRSTNNKERLIVNSIGEGAICVSNTNGNIENGDLLQSSDLVGYAEKQDDDLVHNYTIGKATIDCDFQLDSPYYQAHEIENGVRVAFIACSYCCG